MLISLAAGTGLTQPLFYLLFTQIKRFSEENHSEFPCHAFAHCKVFSPAASRRTGALVSVRLWGLPLPWPLPVIGLVSRYLTNCLIGRSAIVKPDRYDSRSDLDHEAFQISWSIRYCPQFPKVIPFLTLGSPRVTQPYATIP